MPRHRNSPRRRPAARVAHPEARRASGPDRPDRPDRPGQRPPTEEPDESKPPKAEPRS